MGWELFLEPAISVTFVTLEHLVKELISPFFKRLLLGGEIQKLLDRLKTVLLTVNAVLDDAEEKQITSPSVKEWVDKLKDEAFQAEDVLDAIKTKYLRQEQKPNKALQELKKFSEKFRVFKESDLKEIVERLERLAKDRDLLNLKANVRRKPPTMFPTTSLPEESVVIGRGEDIEELKKSLLAQQEKIRVIAIVGLGGVGKTSLAQLLYKEMKEEEFESKAWAYVSGGSDVIDVTITILQSFSLRKCDVRDLNILQHDLKEKLNGKKFLLVLDNIWDDDYLNYWELLSRPLKAGKGGSRIIVTTRDQNVASKMGADVTHPLLPLSFEACWSLFKVHAFPPGQAKDHPGLITIAEKIVKKCAGLPLAAKILGGILRPKLEAEKWRKILDSQIWDLADSNILPALILSYYHLPLHLKRCFAYCSIFPKEYKIEKKKLVLLWMAQGFLQQPNGNDTMENVGEEYCRELLSKSLFQSSDDGSCIFMHDLINDLAQLASEEFCCKFENGMTHANWEKARHFAFVVERLDGPRKFVDITTATSLRTFLPVWFPLPGRSQSFSLPDPRSGLDKTVIKDLLENMKCLRVLSFSCYDISDLPESLGKLKLLRYLDLSHTLIEKLPDKTCSLYNLQTLLLSGCSKLAALPKNIGDLVNLRHLDVSGTTVQMPPGFKRLKSLQVMINFVVSTGIGSKMGELSELSHLRMLSISSMERVDAKNASNADLGSKRHLKELGLKWNSVTGVQSALQVFENLRPHKNLKKLTVENYGGAAFPNWLGDAVFSNMVSLTLLNCKYCESLPSLGKLSSLQELYIKNMAGLKKLRNEFFGPFRSLKTLQFENLVIWENWESFPNEGEAFPSLQELHIKDCPKLTSSIPGNLHSLKKLKVIRCKRIKTLPVGSFTKLQFLYIEDCENLSSLSIRDEVLTFFLLEMEIKNCPNLESLPYVRSNTRLPCLQKLELSKCSKLSQFSECSLPPNLKSLIIANCDNLTPKEEWGLHQMKWLTHFEIEGGCSSNVLFSQEKLLPSTLTSLSIIKLPTLKSLGSWLPRIISLEKLIIDCCENLDSMLDGDLPPNLRSLTIMNCNNLNPANWRLHKMKSLFTLEIKGGYGSDNLFPVVNLLPPNLTSLRISDLPNLRSLGDGFHQLIWLDNLEINNCENLSMPAEISHITNLYIPKLGLP